MTDIEKAVAFLQERGLTGCKNAIILGSGLGGLADSAENRTCIDYADIPGFPISTVSGHHNRLVAGTIAGKKVIMMQGRFHYYEGHAMQKIIFPVRVLKKLGISNLIVTNAAGGVNTLFSPGDLMLITDHIKLVADSPLRGANDDEFGPRFNDMSSVYSSHLITLAANTAAQRSIGLRKGVYMYMTGPSYETPAEIRAARVLGADAVGMSTVPEVIAATHCGMEILGISCITNMAAGILDKPLDHSEVMETAERVKSTFIRLVSGILELL
ncbi:MAG: purine-nucleoside phosphorylase [Spirochaetales bacterium]|nr:purine-nucleoside phosphorylase [Spirochaetales bacterium]